MGIRIHKVLGYGLNDLALCRVDEHHEKIVDGRINVPSIDARYNDVEGDAWESTLNTFHEWIKEHREELQAAEVIEWGRNRSGVFLMESHVKDIVTERISGPSGWSPGHSVVHETEGGDSKVMVFIPPEYTGQWRRYDDSIDYYEEAPEELAPRVKLVQRPIYPFDAVMRRARDPAPELTAKLMDAIAVWKEMEPIAVVCDDKGPLFLPNHVYTQLTGTYSRGMEPFVKGEFLDHLLTDWRPPIPMGVIAVTRFLNIAADEAALINSLRPMIYTYWS